MAIKCIVVDDSPLAIEKLEGFISKVPVLDLLKSYDNGLDALFYLKENQVDLVFLDIQMEQFTGLQFLASMEVSPKVIMVSAYAEYAVKGFDYSVVDYLLKPYSFERFLKAVEKAQNELNIKQERDYIFVKTAYRMERVDLPDILYIEGQGAYLKLVTRKNKIMTLQSLQKMEELLPADHFIRVHKSYIVAFDKIDKIERNVILIGAQRIPVGLSYRNQFNKMLGLDK